MLATVNGWNTQEKAAYLAVSLKGTAVNVLNGVGNDRAVGDTPCMKKR